MSKRTANDSSSDTSVKIARPDPFEHELLPLMRRIREWSLNNAVRAHDHVSKAGTIQIMQGLNFIVKKLDELIPLVESTMQTLMTQRIRAEEHIANLKSENLTNKPFSDSIRVEYIPITSEVREVFTRLSAELVTTVKDVNNRVVLTEMYQESNSDILKRAKEMFEAIPLPIDDPLEEGDKEASDYVIAKTRYEAIRTLSRLPPIRVTSIIFSSEKFPNLDDPIYVQNYLQMIIQVAIGSNFEQRTQSFSFDDQREMFSYNWSEDLSKFIATWKTRKEVWRPTIHIRLNEWVYEHRRYNIQFDNLERVKLF